MLTLDDAIEYCRFMATKFGNHEDESARQMAGLYRQMTGWLKELKYYREKEDDGR